MVVYTWRYEKETINDQEVVKRKKMTWEEGEAWDKEKLDQLKQDISQGKVPGVPAGVDPNASATWKLFYDQLALWQEYLQQTILVDVDLTSSVDDITWAPGGNQPGQPGYQPTGVEGVVGSNQNKSIDEQTGEFFSLGGAPAEGQNPAVVTRDQVLEQVLNLYEVFKQQSQEADQETYKSAESITTGLAEREGRRLAYRNWLDDRKEMVVEAAQDWGKRQQGQVVVVDGVQYELYSPTQGLPKGAGPSDVVRVVTENLTPYDLLNPDGTQKEPEGR